MQRTAHLSRRLVSSAVRPTFTSMGAGQCLVDVYLMRVTGVLEHWLEDRLRRRQWLPIRDAAQRLRAELRPFLHAVGGIELES